MLAAVAVFATMLSPVPLARLDNARTVLTVDTIDVVHPALSPDGKQLAVSEVFLRPSGEETTAIDVIDVDTGHSHRILSPEAAQEHEVYATWATALRWSGNDKVIVTLSDGDAGGSVFTIDAQTGKVIATHLIEDADELVSDALKPILRDTRAYRKRFTPIELELSLGSAVQLDSGRIVLQRIRDENPQKLFLLDPRKRSVSLIARVSDSLHLVAAIERNGYVAFALAAAGSLRVYTGNEELVALTKLGDYDMYSFIPFRERLLLICRARDRGERSLILEFPPNGAPISWAEKYVIQDLTLSSDGSTIAFTHWVDGKRTLTVLREWSGAR